MAYAGMSVAPVNTLPNHKPAEDIALASDWVSKEFGCLYAEPSRNGIYKTPQFHGRGTPMVNMGEMFGFEVISNQEMNRVELTAREISTSVLQDGDLLFGRRSVVPAGAGKCSLVLSPVEPITFESSIIRVRLDKSKAYPQFYYYFFASPVGRSTVSAIVSGTNVKGIRSTELKCLEVPLLPRTEQMAIAEALGNADALIESLQQLVAKKRQIKQGAIQMLLSGKQRLPGFGGEWPIRALGDLFEFSGGFTASRDQLGTEGHCYLHYGDIHTSSKSFIDVRAEHQDIPKLDVPLKRVSSVSLLAEGDVVFVDASEDDEGTSKHVVILNTDGRPFISGLHTIVAKAKTDDLVHDFLRHCFHTSAIKNQFRFFAVGTKVSGISKTNVAKVAMPVPSVAEQTAIATALSDMDTEIAALESRLAKTRDIKQGMMQALLTGRIRLPIESAAA